jgi:hypothetical protein
MAWRRAAAGIVDRFGLSFCFSRSVLGLSYDFSFFFLDQLWAACIVASIVISNVAHAMHVLIHINAVRCAKKYLSPKFEKP